MDRYLGSTHAPITCFIPTDYRKNNDPPIRMGFLIKEIGYLRRQIVSVAVYMSELIPKCEQAKFDCAAWEQWAKEICTYVEGYKEHVKKQFQEAHVLWRARDDEIAALRAKLQEAQLALQQQELKDVEHEEELKAVRAELMHAKMQIFWMQSKEANTNAATCSPS